MIKRLGLRPAEVYAGLLVMFCIAVIVSESLAAATLLSVPLSALGIQGNWAMLLFVPWVATPPVLLMSRNDAHSVSSVIRLLRGAAAVMLCVGLAVLSGLLMRKPTLFLSDSPELALDVEVVGWMFIGPLSSTSCLNVLFTGLGRCTAVTSVVKSMETYRKELK